MDISKLAVELKKHVAAQKLCRMNDIKVAARSLLVPFYPKGVPSFAVMKLVHQYKALMRNEAEDEAFIQKITGADYKGDTGKPQQTGGGNRVIRKPDGLS
ncbi:MAG: hypothetical protein KDA80_22960 [Planctomycetaceae bacterium]|nr:hypothetical protein [Planctomycetaceae bacterium]